MNQKKFKNIKKWAKDLFPLNRSLTGKDNRITINYIKKNINSSFKLKKVKSGKKVYSWRVPKEYSISEATIKDNQNKTICDFKNNHLHVVGYSKSINKFISYKDLKKKIFISNIMPQEIPYITSYYKKDWGFCLSREKFRKLKKNIKYKVRIRSKHFSGYMNYGEMVIKGKSKKEILICSYICHPALANNELSGILAICLLSQILKKTKYTIRLLLIPETIGAIYYIKKNINRIKKNMIAGFNITCVGIDGPLTLISSISENTYADRVTRRVGLKYSNFRKLSFNHRGSNERQFGCQNLNLPFVTICRKKFGEYKEYHTSADNLKIMNYKTIIETVKFIKKIITEINKNKIFKKKNYCEPFLTRTKLINNFSTIQNMRNFKRKSISDFLAYVNKNHDLKSLAQTYNIPNINKLALMLKKNKLIKEEI